MNPWDANKLYVVDGRVMRLLYRMLDSDDVPKWWRQEIKDIYSAQPEVEAYQHVDS